LRHEEGRALLGPWQKSGVRGPAEVLLDERLEPQVADADAERIKGFVVVGRGRLGGGGVGKAATVGEGV
jgi:hypothetical protein